jgi:hypothetical protein
MASWPAREMAALPVRSSSSRGSGAAVARELGADAVAHQDHGRLRRGEAAADDLVHGATVGAQVVQLEHRDALHEQERDGQQLEASDEKAAHIRIGSR